MKKRSRKIISIILSVMLILGTFMSVIPVFAADASVYIQNLEATANNVNGLRGENGFQNGNVKNGQYWPEAQNPECNLATDDLSKKGLSVPNYTLELDLMVRESSNASPIFGYIEGNGGLMWQFAVRDGKMTLNPHHYAPGLGRFGDSVDIDDAYLNDGANGLQHIKIVVTEGKYVATYINGHCISERIESQYASFGNIGMRSNLYDGPAGIYDNFKVTNDDTGDILYENDFENAAAKLNMGTRDDSDRGYTCGGTITWAEGMELGMSFAPMGYATAEVYFDIPKDADYFTGWVGMCDEAINNNHSCTNDKVWFTIDGGEPVGELTLMPDGDRSQNHFEFKVAIPDGAEKLTVYVNNPDFENADHISFFNTYFGYANTADYSAVETAKSAAAALTEADYTAASWAKLTAALAAVVEDLTDDKQAEVDKMAADINAAVDALIFKTLEMNIDISEGIAVQNGDKFNITWNADVIIGADTTIGKINGLAKFIDYGVYYGTSEAEVDKLAAGTDTEQAAQMSFKSTVDDNDSVNVYTIFGFRLKGVAAEKNRAAKFYITYEYNGNIYTVLSDTIAAETGAIAAE